MIKDHAYSDGITNKKIAIIGRYPPPVGGISIHIQRVIEKFNRQNNQVFFFESGQSVRFIFFYLYLIKLVFFLLRARADIVYYHVLYMDNALEELSYILFLKHLLHHRIIIVDHNCRYLYKQNKQFKNKLNTLITSVDEQIFIGQLTEKSYDDNAIIRPQKWSIEAAFLPPNGHDEFCILDSYPSDVMQFIHSHTPILVINAFKLCLLSDGKDLYGIDQAIHLLYQLKQRYSSVGLFIALGEYGDKKYLSTLYSRIDAWQLRSNIYILSGHHALWPIIKKADIFLRPTLSDGDSISIREALYFNVPVVATNVCTRPEGVLCYKIGDENHLYYLVNVLCAKKLKG